MRDRALRMTTSRPRAALAIYHAPDEDVQSRADAYAWRLSVWTVVLPLVGLLALTLVFRWTAADVSLCQLFYGGPGVAWPGQNAEPWLTLYRFGPYPGLMLGFAGVGLAVAGLLWAELKTWRAMGLFLALTLALGPGLIVNGILKPQWGRPRPAQIKSFGGDQEFVGVWGFGSPGISKSFPSGHASMGFYLMAPAFLLYPRRPRLAAAFLMLGLAGGGLLGLARVAQGQHFASDVIWSGGLVYFSCLFLGYLFHRLSAREEQEADMAVEPVLLPWDAGRDMDVEQTDGGSGSGARIRRRAA